MGIDIHALKFLVAAKANGVDFSRTLTIGRQAIDIDKAKVNTILNGCDPIRNLDKTYESENRYSETLLKDFFAANTVHSIDASDYEGASIVADLNTDISSEEQFTAVLDFGCLEHVFNVAQAFDNVVRFCDIGGHILHILPTNNFCGHGFYQFSPEFFFSLYSEDRGFTDLAVYVAELNDQNHWYHVRSTRELRRRLELIDSDATYVLSRVQKGPNAVCPLTKPPQPSDYELVLWQTEGYAQGDLKKSAKDAVTKTLSHVGTLEPVRELWRYHVKNRQKRLSGRRRELDRIDV